MVSARLVPISYLKGGKGDKGEKGDVGTIATVAVTMLPAGSQPYVVMSGPQTARHAQFFVPRGLPGVNALENDTAVAAYIAALDSKVRAALEKLFTPKDLLTFLTSDHGVVGDGTADDTATMQALIDSVPDGATIVGPPGAVYRTAGWQINQKSVTLDLSDCHVIRTGDASLVTAWGEYDQVQQVAAASTVALTVADSSLYKQGDVVKVFSDNVLNDARHDNLPDQFPRRGEYATVRSVDFQTVNLSSHLIDTYDTNVRVARLVKDHKVRVLVGSCEHAESAGSVAMFTFYQLYAPEIVADIRKNNGTGVGMISCFAARTDIEVDNLPAGNGYGMTSRASAYGDYNIVARTCRHAYTDGPGDRDVELNSPDIYRYGRTMFETIRGSSQGTLQASWDTHHGSYGNRFVNIVANGARDNAGSTHPIFSLRGRFHQLIGCTAVGGSHGIRIFSEQNESWARSENHRIVNCVVKGSVWPIEVSAYEKMPAERGVSATIEGGEFESTRRYCLYISNARVQLNGPVFRHMAETQAVDQGIISMGRGTLVGSCTVEAMNLTAGVDSIIYSPTNSGLYETINLDLELRMSDAALQAGGRVWRAGNVAGQVRARANRPTTMVPIQDALRGAPDQSASLKVLQSNGIDGVSSARSFTNPSSGAAISTMLSADPVVVLRYNSASNVTLGAVAVGIFPGQMIVFVNAGAGSITIPTGSSSYNTVFGSDLVIASGGSASIVWDGSAWRRAN